MALLDINKEIDIFVKYYNENYTILDTASKYFSSLVNSILLEQVPIQTVISRVKQQDECISKFKRKYQNQLEDSSTPYSIKEYITDLIGVRIICLYKPDIEKVKKLLKENFDILEVSDKIKDIESTENQFGYKSLHLDLRLDDRRKSLPENKQYADLQFEVQIRTIIQDAWCVLDHKIKYRRNIPSPLKRRINRLAASFELADDEFDNIRIDTTKYEQEAKATINKPNQKINIFSFLEVVIPAFPTYQFITYKADGFVHEILELNSRFTKEEFQKSLNDHLEIVKKFNSDIVFQTPSHYLNPYTMIRHCLYMYDKEKFKDILFEIQRDNFEEWHEERN